MSAPRLLIVRFSAIGDAVMAAWTATSFRNRHPEGLLVWAVESRCAAVVDRSVLVDECAEFPRDRWKSMRWSPEAWRQQLRAYTGLRRHRFDFGLDLQGHSKTALCLRLSGARRRLATRATDAIAARLNPLLPPLAPPCHSVERSHSGLTFFGDYTLPTRPLMPPAVEVPGAPEADRLITISVSAGQADKAYPADQWGLVAEDLIRGGWTVAFLGGPTDRPIDVKGALDFVGRLDLASSMELVRRSRLHLCGDTGSGHMAAALRVPVVSVFGPTDPAQFRPYTSTGKVLRHGIRTGDVPVQEVLAAAQELLR